MLKIAQGNTIYNEHDCVPIKWTDTNGKTSASYYSLLKYVMPADSQYDKRYWSSYECPNKIEGSGFGSGVSPLHYTFNAGNGLAWVGVQSDWTFNVRRIKVSCVRVSTSA